MALYHATPEENVERILEEGFVARPLSDSVDPAWDDDTHIPKPSGRGVYLARRQESARGYAGGLARARSHPQKSYAIFKVNVSLDDDSVEEDVEPNLFTTPLSAGGLIHRGDIPPEKIELVEVVSDPSRIEPEDIEIAPAEEYRYT